jgi:nucleoid DNA-binding protein
MNRSQLINILAQKTGLNKKDVKRTIDEMQKLIIQEVKGGACMVSAHLNLVFNPAAQHET